MTVGEMINLLKEYPENSEIRLAFQKTWPLRFDIHGICSDEELTEYAEENEDDLHEKETDKVWIVPSDGHPNRDKSPYASKDLWAVTGRGNNAN